MTKSGTRLKDMLGHLEAIPPTAISCDAIVSMNTTYLKEGECFLGRIRREGTPQHL